MTHASQPEFDEFSPYPPIADYGFLSDCEVTALIAPGGSVEWMCLPRMDGPSVFGSMMDRDAGWFRFGPADMAVPADRRYLAGTMVLETVWDCGEGWLIVRDCLVIGPWRHENPQRGLHRRPPTDYDAEHILLRTVRCTNGTVQLVLDCEPAFDYGRRREQWNHTDAHGRLLWTAHHWRHWLARGNLPDHRWRAHVTRSALTLKGLAYAPTGAIAAAATTS